MVITGASTTDLTTKAQEAYDEAIGAAIRMPTSVEKFRAIAVLWMRHPLNGAENRQQMAACAEYCRELRETRANKFGSSTDKNSGLRSMFSPPGGLLTCIEAFYHDGFLTGKEGRRNWKLFRQAFPEFNASDVF